MTRALLTAATIGTLTGVLLTFGPHGAVGIAVCAAGVIAWYLVSAVRRDRRRARDKRRQYRDQVWRRRIDDAGGIRGGRDPWWLHTIPDDVFERWNNASNAIIFNDPPFRDRSGMGCGRCGRQQFFSHTCIDGEMVRGAYDGLVG